MNTYKKYCPNVFVAKCKEMQNKGDVITLTTKRGKENKHIVWNLIGRDRDGSFYYSITREDGFNAQERAKNRTEKLQGYQANALKRSDDAYNSRATKQELDFLSLGEPIKIGHHSEKRHSKLFEKYDNKMRKSFEEKEKSESYESRIEYWKDKENEINLSMPESIDFFIYKLEEAKEYHEGLKSGKYKKEHSFSMTYAKKKVNELTNKVELAKRLWE